MEEAEKMVEVVEPREDMEVRDGNQTVEIMDTEEAINAGQRR